MKPYIAVLVIAAITALAIQILVVGVANEAGGVQTLTPALFYAGFPVEEVEM